MQSGWVGFFDLMELGCIVHVLTDAIKMGKEDICLVFQFEMRRKYLLVYTVEVSLVVCMVVQSRSERRCTVVDAVRLEEK